MGWFWADKTSPAPAAPTAPHAMPHGTASPPPECPMHNKNTAAPPVPAAAEVPKGACPYVPPENSAADSSPEAPKGLLARLNPLNNMFAELDNSKASTQTRDLPLSREASTIPKGDGSLWEYPSPQQMYNAMLRKGYTDTPVEAVESMVSVHNFLNEGAWAEIMGWERRFSRGLVDGFEICKRGEALADLQLGTADEPFDTTTWVNDDVPPPKLLRFTGRPTEPTPKSQIMQALGWVMPEKFGTPPPFDRHDWFIQRCNKQGCKEIRYIIDYYEGEDHSEDEPVFHLDVRPAVDGPTSAAERLIRSGTELWWQASGGSARMLKQLEAAKKKREEEAAEKGRQYN